MSKIYLVKAAVLAGAMALAPLTAPIAAAQIRDHAVRNLLPENEALSLRATVKSIDPVTRAVQLVGPDGETETIIAGPAVRLQLFKEGDTVDAKYYRSVAFFMNAPGKAAPEDQIKAALARPVTAPGGLAVQETRVSGTVVGIDLTDSTVKVVEPSGGRVWTVHVTIPARRAMLPMLKVGDTITAVISEALAVEITPAKS